MSALNVQGLFGILFIVVCCLIYWMNSVHTREQREAKAKAAKQKATLDVFVGRATKSPTTTSEEQEAA